MTDFEKAQKTLADNVKAYRTAAPNDGEAIIAALQQIAGALHYLENERAMYHKKWSEKVNLEVLGGTSVSRAENMANVEYPEMYLLRRIMESGYATLNIGRSHIGWLKQERNGANFGG